MKNVIILTLLILSSLSFAQKTKGNKCNLQIAENKIVNLKETRAQQKNLDSLFNKKRGVSIMSDFDTINGKKYFRIKTGFSGEFHWDTYNIFYVDQKTCREILVNETVSGDIISLADWRKFKKY